MGFLKGRIEDYSSPLAAVPARLYTGYFFFIYGLEKAMGGFRGPGLRQTLEGWAEQTRYRFYVPFLQNLAIPYPDVFAWLVILGEIGVGVALLLGCASRFAALVGAFLCLNDLFASGVPLVSLEQPVVFTVLLVTIYATAAGRALGLDAFLARRLPGWAA